MRSGAGALTATVIALAFRMYTPLTCYLLAVILVSGACTLFTVKT